MSNQQNQDDKDHELFLQNLEEVMGTPAGRDVIFNILSLCDLYSDKFTGNSSTFMLLGKSSVGLDIIRLLADIDPRLYPKLLLEKAEK